MKKEDVEQKIRTRIDTLGSNLLGKGISLSDDAKQQLCKNLSKEVWEDLRIKFRREVHEETKRFFAELEKDLGYSFNESIKGDILLILFAEAGLSDEEKSSEAEDVKKPAQTGTVSVAHCEDEYP